MTTPNQPTGLHAYGALCESLNTIRVAVGTARAQATIIAAAELTAEWLRTAPPAHVEAVCLEAAEILRSIKADAAATGEA